MGLLQFQIHCVWMLVDVWRVLVSDGLFSPFFVLQSSNRCTTGFLKGFFFFFSPIHFVLVCAESLSF